MPCLLAPDHTDMPTLEIQPGGTGSTYDLSRTTTLVDSHSDPNVSRSQLSTSTEATKEKGSHWIYVDFEPGDRRNPANFTRGRKWAITGMGCFATFLTSAAGPNYNMGFPSMIRSLNCTEFQATIGLSVFALGFGVVPLVTAPLSEEFGRRPLYFYSAVGFTAMYIMIALGNNIQMVIVARFLQSAFGAIGSAMIGGTIADIWETKERGLPMSLYTAASFVSTGIGPTAAGWIEINPRLGWQWIQWIQMMISGVYLILLPMIMVETRPHIILTRIAKTLRKEHKDDRYRAKVETERVSIRLLIFTSCTRPIYMLFTEPVALSFSLWVGFAYGISFCMISSISGIFETLHNFNIGEVGSIFSCMAIGTIIGFFVNLYQETLYQKYFPKRGPEARLYLACFAAVLFPAAMFVYAWSSYSSVPWIAQAIAIVAYTWATFLIYLSAFSYLADCYGPFASSALAAQGLARNLLATAFPLFTQQMFDALSYKWANTLFAFIAVIMIPIPFALFFYGPTIRRMSKISRAVAETLD